MFFIGFFSFFEGQADLEFQVAPLENEVTD